MYTMAISTTPGSPERVFCRIALGGQGLIRDCLVAFQGRLGLVGVTRLERYAIGVEPVIGLLARWLLLVPAEDLSPALAMTPASYVSVSVYQGDRVDEEALREHVVGTSNGVLFQVEFADEDCDRRTAGVAHPELSVASLLGMSISTLLWGGRRPAALSPLSTVLTYEEDGPCVLAEEIPSYTRRRFLRSLGSVAGPAPAVLPACDWLNFLAAVLADADGVPGGAHQDLQEGLREGRVP